MIMSLNSRRYSISLVLLLMTGLLTVAFSRESGAERREFRQHQFFDSRYHHDHYYPSRGLYVNILPPRHRIVVFGGTRYYFFDGVWYRPRGGRFLIVAPPIGLVVPFLPPYYTTITIGGIPYFYANEVYYTAGPGGYVVVAPPVGEISPVLPPSESSVPARPPAGGQTSAEQLFIYPGQGQDEKKQADDRFECHRWAVGQTGYDPTRPGDLPEPQKLQKYADYKRAMGACLEGRGYTVK
jgi:hypothetical protein